VISGYEGIAVARSEHLNGCISICIEGGLGKDDKGLVRRDEIWFDEQRITVIEMGAYQHQGDYAGDQPGPRQMEDGIRLATAGGPGMPTPPRDGR
jgi:hypothetical protein